jgi:hypothetical protein
MINKETIDPGRADTEKKKKEKEMGYVSCIGILTDACTYTYTPIK